MFSSFTCGWRYLRDEASVNEISISPGQAGKLCLGADLAEGFFLVSPFLLPTIGLKNQLEGQEDVVVGTRSLRF